MDEMKVVIVEDERITALSLEDMLIELGCDVTGSFITAEQAIEEIRKSQPDLVLLDINLKGEHDGIWLGGTIKKELNIPFIYLTSYGDKETIEKATNTMPYGYLVKPIDKQNLHAAIELAAKRFGEENDNSEEEEPLVQIKDSLFVKDEYYFTKITLSEIFHIKVDGNYLELYTNDKRHLIRGSLKSLFPKLPKKLFVQVHRSHVVNIEKVDGFGSNFVRIGKESIPVSKAYQDSLKECFDIF